MDQDDIDFDEEELQGERPGDQRPQAQEDFMVDDEMDASTLAAVEQIESSYNDTLEATAGSPPRASARATSVAAPLRTSSPGGTPAAPPPPAVPKRKLRITHDKYITIRDLVIMHLAEHERTATQGIDRDELIDWYLEYKEKELTTVEELDYEKELFGKILNKLVKVRTICDSLAAPTIHTNTFGC